MRLQGVIKETRHQPRGPSTFLSMDVGKISQCWRKVSHQCDLTGKWERSSLKLMSKLDKQKRSRGEDDTGLDISNLIH